MSLIKIARRFRQSPSRGAVASSSTAPAAGSAPERICPRKQDFSAWYSDVLRASGMVDDSPIRGCMVIRPWGMRTWELLRDALDAGFKEKDIENAYFPLFIPRSYIEREAQHVDGFAKECAVVTHHRLCVDQESGAMIPDPTAKLAEPLIVRPTSETAIWSTFSKWIQSYRDLPLRINQWANVVRWEMRPRPFLRTSEFLWQEGHTAHADSDDALKTTREMLDLYSTVCRDVLALPTIPGVKSPNERFAGAVETYTIEACMQNGWALQCGTSHYLGQNFAKAFDVQFNTDSSSGEREYVWGTSWGVSTRLLGAVVMTHSDDTGLVLPPAVAPLQVVVVPILKRGGEEDPEVTEAVSRILLALKKAGVRHKAFPCEGSALGSRRYEWERKGVPIRLEVGGRDVKAGEVTAAVRLHASKIKLSIPASVEETVLQEFSGHVAKLLHDIQSEMLRTAEQRQRDMTFHVSSYTEMKSILENAGSKDAFGCSKGLGLFVAPWKNNTENEIFIKEDCKATIRCFPDDLNSSPLPRGTKCFFSGDEATHIAIFARAF